MIMEEKVMDYQFEIVSIIENNIDFQNLSELLEQYHPYDLSRAILELDEDLLKSFFTKVEDDLLSDIFEHFTLTEVEDISHHLSPLELARIVELMDVDLAVDLIKVLKKSGFEILKHIEQTKKKTILELLQYQEDEIGSYINDSFMTISVDSTIKGAMKYITQHAHEFDYISIIYVVEDNQLIGYIKLKDLIVARANEYIKDVMEIRFPLIHPHDDVEKVARIMQETRESSIPIINEDHQILGIVTHDDLVDIVLLEEEEDYTMFAGLSDYDSDSDVLSIKRSVKTRLPWLLILLGLSLFTSLILSLFNSQLSSTQPGIILASQLAVFLPLILGMAGNTGTQSLAVTIRYLSKNENVEKQVLQRMIIRELKTGLIQGLFIGIIVFVMILLTRYGSQNNLVALDFIYGLVTSLSIFIALVISTTLGGLIPMFMYKLKIDPAVASGPFITTLSDIVTLSIYYAIGMSILLPLY
jgi:magnesium transporter